jgi:hypothetical protein
LSLITTYNEFNNVVSSSYLYWQGGNSNVSFNATYQNNRVTSSTDAGQSQTWNYDAMGNRTSLMQNGNAIETIAINALGRAANAPLDGEGQPIKVVNDFYIRSTVLGGAIVTQLDSSGVKNKGRVIDDGNLLAEQIVSASGNTVQWHHRDPLNLVARDTEPGQLKRKTFAINPVGAQIESTEGVSTGQYYACLYGGQNNPGCTGYTPQPPGGYGAAANGANGQYAQSIKVDGVLTLGSIADALAQTRRTGHGSVHVSSALSGTALGGSFIHRTNYDLVSTPNIYTENGELLSRGQRILDISDSILWVPGGDQSLKYLQGSQGSSSKGNDQNKPQPPLLTTCERMSRDAQNFADQTQSQFPKATPSFRLQHFNRLFGRFTYGANFEEGPLGFIGNSAPSSGRVQLFGIGRPYQGQDGFDPRFYDNDSIQNGRVNLNWDQVHHVGAYLSAALAGHKFAPAQARNSDTSTGNLGDVYLADQSTALGWYLRLNPKQLSNIGTLLRSTMCLGNSVPGHERR